MLKFIKQIKSNKMGLKKGMVNNPKGRTPGTPNRITAELRQRISDFLTANWTQFEKDFKGLEPEKRIAMYEKLLQYSLPKPQHEQIVEEPKEDITSVFDKYFTKMQPDIFKKGQENIPSA